MKKMPKSIEIMGRVLPIKYIEKEALNEMIQNAEGIYDTYERGIYINKAAPQKIQKYYIYHETGHAILSFTGLDQVLPAEVQELICQSFATMTEDYMNQYAKFK